MLEYLLHGGMAERTKAPVLKTGIGQPIVGSNPTSSAGASHRFWGGARVDDWGRLLSGCRVRPTRGSNPRLSAFTRPLSRSCFFNKLHNFYNLQYSPLQKFPLFPRQLVPSNRLSTFISRKSAYLPLQIIKPGL